MLKRCATIDNKIHKIYMKLNIETKEKIQAEYDAWQA